MKNSFKHLKDGTTLITVRYGESDEVKEVIIDTEDFQKVSAINGTWIIWKKQNSDKEEIGCLLGRKRFVMHRLLMGNPEGLVVFNKSGNAYDLRKSNLRVGNNGDQNKRNSVNQAKVTTKKQASDKKESPAFAQLNPDFISNIGREVGFFEIETIDGIRLLSENDVRRIQAIKLT